MQNQKILFVLLILWTFLAAFASDKPENPLHAAILKGDLNEVKTLVKGGADVNLPDRNGDSPLTLAVRRGHEAVVNLLLESNAKPPKNTEKAQQMQLQAARFGMELLMKRLLRTADPRKPRNTNGGTLLHEAAAGGHPGIIGELIQRGLRTNVPDRNGWTPLHYAAARGRNTAILILLRHEAPLNSRDIRGRTAYNLAREHARTHAANLLLRKGAEPSQPDFPKRKGPWMGEAPPGDTPRLFAPGIVSGHYALHGSISFSPDGKTAAWRPMAPANGTILFSTQKDGFWTAPAPLFPPGPRHGAQAPIFAPDGGLLFLTPTQESRKFVLEQMIHSGNGWSAPLPLMESLPDDGILWQFSMDRSKNLFFATDRGIFRSEFHPDGYAAPRKLDIPGIGMNAVCPYIAPDGRYLLFSASPSAAASLDLFVTFRLDTGKWAPAQALNAPINSAGMEICPMVSADGDYLFFIRWHQRVHGIYWVSTRSFRKLSPKK